MCLIVFAHRYHHRYRLVLAANRDEFLERPTAPLGLHYPDLPILAGHDLRGGGTWLALAANGRFGAITNYRDPARHLIDAPSRGGIILEYLRSSLPARDYLMSTLAEKAQDYEGFNLLLGDGHELLYFSNVSGEVRPLAPGLYGLSNHLLDTPWPKVERVKERFADLLATDDELGDEEIFAMLADRTCPDDRELPDTGVGMDWERRLAPICISAPGYGTRSSSLLTIRDDGRARFSERCYHHLPALHVASEQTFSLTVSGFLQKE